MAPLNDMSALITLPLSGSRVLPLTDVALWNENMSVRDYKPLPTACVKNLCDKLFEKRKAGAMEVEQ